MPSKVTLPVACQSRSVQTEPKLKHKSMQTLRVNQRAQMQQTAQVKFVDAIPSLEQKGMQTDLIEEQLTKSSALAATDRPQVNIDLISDARLASPPC